jgi:hypothetical protein
MIRKFYAATSDAGAGAATEAVEEQVNIAEMMAKHGSKSDETGRRPEPIEIPGKKDEQKVETQSEAATVKVESKAEVNPEPKKEPVKEEPKAETAPIVAEKQKPESTLDEVLKQNQPKAVFKALGFDDQKAEFIGKLKDIDPKVVNLIEAYENGTLGNYVKELATDYSKMEAEEVMRHQLRVDYPKATPKQLEILYKREIIDHYNLDSVDEDEAAEGRELLAAKADRFRDSFIANQEKYLLPQKPQPKQKLPDNSEDEATQRVEAYRKELKEHPYTKNIIANKFITVGEGTEAYNYPVDADSLIDVLSDGKKWAETMWDIKEGVPRTEHQLMVAAFALDSKKFLSEYAKHLQAVGAKEVIDPIENAKPADGSTTAKSEPTIDNPAAAMAKYGKRIPGGVN